MDLKSLDAQQLAELEEKLKKSKEKVEAFVKQYPLVSVGIAFGIGLVIARFFFRSSRR